jgi:hypothetical protein
LFGRLVALFTNWKKRKFWKAWEWCFVRPSHARLVNGSVNVPKRVVVVVVATAPSARHVALIEGRVCGGGGGGGEGVKDG